MRTISKLLFGTLAMGTMLWSCAPDNVAPKSEDPTMGKYAENPHPMMNPGCSDTATLRLQSTSGSFKVDYGCTTNCPDWGSAYVLNGVDSVGIYITMSTGWMIDFSKSRIDIASNFTFDPSGFPSTANDFVAIDVNPLVNKWALFRDKSTIAMGPGNCFAVAMNLTVARASFLGAIIPSSVRTLWAYNDGWDEEFGPYNAPSPYLLNWCWVNCPVTVAVDSFCTDMTPSIACRDLTPDVSGLPAGPYTYNWSNSATTPTINVCPAAAPSYYSVTITAGADVVAIYTYCVPQLPPVVTLSGGTCYGCRTLYSATFTGGSRVTVNSTCKDMTNVRVGYKDCTTTRFTVTGRTATFDAPPGKVISAVWIKAGCQVNCDCTDCGPRLNNTNPGTAKNTNCNYVYN